jgi:hypothetical protein
MLASKEKRMGRVNVSEYRKKRWVETMLVSKEKKMGRDNVSEYRKKDG